MESVPEKDPADRQNGIAAVDQIAHGMVDRQACADGGVVQPVTPGFFSKASWIWRYLLLSLAPPASLLALMTWKPWLAKSRYWSGELLAGGNVQHH